MSQTPLLAVDPLHPQPEIIAEAARLLRGGGVIVFPTDPVYGIGCAADHPEAIARIYAAKGRAADQPLSLLVAEAADLQRYGSEVSAAATRAVARFWPGALTVIVHRSSAVPAVAVGGRDTVGVRLPDHAVSRALAAALGAPFGTTSANRSGGASPTTAAEAAAALGDRVDLILDGGASLGGRASAVIDFTTTPPRVVRAGALSPEDLAMIIDEGANT
jgi:L-threonylcarbamoyladenylate synthase